MLRANRTVRLDLDKGCCETLRYITVHHKRIDLDEGWCETLHYITIHHKRIDLDEGWYVAHACVLTYIISYHIISHTGIHSTDTQQHRDATHTYTRTYIHAHRCVYMSRYVAYLLHPFIVFFIHIYDSLQEAGNGETLARV